MTITKEDSIVTQVAAKIAGEIAAAVPAQDLTDALSNYEIAFQFVKDSLFNAHVGDATAAVQTAFAGTTVATAAAAPVSQTVAPAAPGTLRIAGTQHGDLPAWLIKATLRDGVTEVWDNRDKAVGTNRPHFKQAGVPSADAKGYWPPKGS